MSDRSSAPRASGRRAGWLRRLGIAFVVLALLVMIAPAVIARTGLRDRLINTIMAAPSLTASTGAASLGWISPVLIDDLKIEGKQHRFRIEVDSVTTDRPWPQLLASSPDLGTISVEKPRLWCKLPLGEKGTVSPILSPIFTAAIHDASVSVESDLSDQPLIDFDGVDLTAHVRDSDQGRWLSVEPFEIYQREVLTPEHCDQLLGLISPSLGDAAEVEGEFSLSMSNLRVPIGLSEREAMEQLEAQGELALHRVAIQTGNPMLKMLAKLVADIHQTQPPSQTRVVKDALIKFQARDGRLYHEGLRFGFPDIDPGLEVLARGSVGLDQSLDTVLEIPRLDPAKQQQKGPVRCQVTGTVGNPQFSVQDASLVVRLPNRAEPLIDVDGVDFSAHVDDSPSGRVISFDPMELLDRDKIDRNLASTLLQFVDPGLGYSPKVDGEVSLSLDQLRLPIGAVDDDWLQSLRLDGTLTIHEATSDADTPIRQAIVKLLADLCNKQPTRTVRIAHDAEIEFQLIDGRFHFEGVRAGFPDLDPRLEMISRGSVGLDQTLDIDLEIPRLDATKHKERGPVRCHLTGTVSNPQLSAKDASLLVRLPDRSEPLIDIDGVNLVLRVDKQEGRPVIAVDPVQLLTREKISRQLGTGLLHLVDPELQYSPDLVGELSLSVDTMRIPVGGPDAQWLADLEVRGQMTIHQLSSLTQSPLRVALAKLLADLYSIRPGESVRVVHDAEIDFGLYQNRFHFQGLQFGFPDIDPKLQVHVDGSIGLDQTLDLHLQLPRLDATKRQQKGLVECHITGTVAQPELAVTDASLVVRLPEHEQPLLDVDGVDLKMEIRQQDDVPVLELAPVNLFDHRRLESQRGEEWLRLLVPALADVADVEGEFSLSIDSMHVPLSGSKQQLLRSTELDGQLQLHEVTTTVGTPLLTAMVKVLADQYGKSPSQTVRVAKDCQVHFQLREGRLFQEGLRIGLPEFSPDLVCRVGGSVGVDRSLDLVLQVPAALAGTATGQSGDVRFTVTGTLDNPTVAQADK